MDSTGLEGALTAPDGQSSHPFPALCITQQHHHNTLLLSLHWECSTVSSAGPYSCTSLQSLTQRTACSLQLAPSSKLNYSCQQFCTAQSTHSRDSCTATMDARGWITPVKYTAQTAYEGHWKGLSRTITQCNELLGSGQAQDSAWPQKAKEQLCR